MVWFLREFPWFIFVLILVQESSKYLCFCVVLNVMWSLTGQGKKHRSDCPGQVNFGSWAEVSFKVEVQ